MPQFDLTFFYSQIVWLFIIFFTFYLIFLYYFLPRLVEPLKIRKRRQLKVLIFNSKLNYFECNIIYQINKYFYIFYKI